MTTVLAEDENQPAGAWIRSYGGPPDQPATNLTTLQLVAERFPD